MLAEAVSVKLVAVQEYTMFEPRTMKNTHNMCFFP